MAPCPRWGHCSNGAMRYLSCLLVICCFGVAGGAAAERVFTPGTSGRGELVYLHGVPVLRLRGSPQEMGAQQGALIGPQLRDLYAGYFGPFLRDGRLLREAVAVSRLTLAEHIPEDYRAEIEALAAAAEMDPAVVLVLQTFLDLSKLVQCSMVCALPPLSDEPLMGRNLDFPGYGIAERYSLVVVRQPDTGRATVSVGWPGLLGILSGYNESGLCLTMAEVYAAATALDGMPYALLYRRVLERSDDVAGAIALLESHRRTVSNNIALMDRADAAVVESASWSQVVRRPRDGVVFCANYFTAAHWAQEPLRGDDRLELLAEHFAQRAPGADAMRAPELVALLDAVDLPQFNLQAMIFAPRRRALSLAIGAPPAVQGTFVDLGWDELLGAARSRPVLELEEGGR